LRISSAGSWYEETVIDCDCAARLAVVSKRKAAVRAHVRATVGALDRSEIELAIPMTGPTASRYDDGSKLAAGVDWPFVLVA
jgi:hypothetical protein